MRSVFGILSLLVVVAIVGVLAKKQLAAVSPAPSTATASPAQEGAALPTGTPKQQVEAVKQQVELQLQQARPNTDAEAK